MKRLFILLSFFAIGSVIFSGCSKEGCTDPTAENYDPDAKKDDGSCIYAENQAPTISDFTITGDPTPGGTLDIHFIAADNEGLSGYTLQSEKGGSTSTDIDASISGGSETVDTVYNIPQTMAVGDALILTITVTDSDGETASDSKSFTISAGGTPLTEQTGGFNYHIFGSSQGSYDLVNNTGVSTPDPNNPNDANAASKDIANTDAGGSTFTGSFTSYNNTSYVKDNNFDYDNATDQSAENAYNSGTSMTTVTNPSVGDIYIAKLRGGSDYVVVKITGNDPNNNDCTCANTGKLSFNYKK